MRVFVKLRRRSESILELLREVHNEDAAEGWYCRDLGTLKQPQRIASVLIY